MEEKLKQKYQQIERDYDDYISKINSSYAPFYLSYVPNKTVRVLDIGCGTGDMLKEISKKRPQLSVFGLDPTPQFVSLAQNKVPHATIIQGEAENLPYEDAFFDFVMSHVVFQHVDRQKALKEAKRVLKPKGTLVIAEVLSGKLDLNMVEKAKYKFSQAERDLFLIKRIGLAKFQAGRKYAKSSDWSELTSIHRSRRFGYEEFVAFYKNHLPHCLIQGLSESIVAVVWSSS